MGEFSSFALVPEQGVIPRMEQLDAQMRQRIERMAAKLDVHDSAAVLGYGARAQKEMAAFSDIALSQMMQRDRKPLDSVIDELCGHIRACSAMSEAKGFFKRIFGAAASVDDLREAYEKAEPRINACADEMTDRRVMLMRDSALLDRLYERNEEIYRELCSLIVVGDEAVRQAKQRGEAHEIAARVERRVEDLRVTQLASAQLAAQIRMVQGSDSVACDKLRTALEVTIPLWKNQMAAALGLARATETLAMHRKAERQASVRRGTKEMLAQRSAYGRATSQSDQERARETARELIRELESIETELKRDMTAAV